jgi:hypothetical protein
MSSADKSATAVLGRHGEGTVHGGRTKAPAMGAGAHGNVSVHCVKTLTKESS